MNTTKVYKYETKRNSILSPPSHFSRACEMSLSDAAVFQWQRECHSLGSLLSFEKLKKKTRREILIPVWICTQRSQAQGSHLAARYWSKLFKLPGKVTLRTQSNCIHHCISVFIHQRGYIQHMTPNITTRPCATSCYKFKSMDSYFNTSLKFDISNLWKASCRLFSSSHCCRQPTW